MIALQLPTCLPRLPAKLGNGLSPCALTPYPSPDEAFA
jgi:hypothetical protein